ncbi:alpha/beta fold hydrolase [Dactylosporangium sp. McL0621]|uniref:alpha/beta fold hydrolase n=1 Tax=Dactylosporangium sp. McL0621 TaxID=3415678 RepID=UPI003CEFD3E1
MMMVDLGGYRVAAHVQPGSDPTVVFVAQMGTAGATWRPVIDLLTTTPAVVTYDRPGIGASDARPEPGKPIPYSAPAAELATMLDGLGVTGPLLLAGHSVGSLFIRMYAANHPDRIAGVVHVDGSIPALRLWPGAPASVDGDRPDSSPVDSVAGEREMAGIETPTVPGVVLCRTPGRWAVALPDPAIDGRWQQAQADLAEQIGATLVVATDAGHQLPREAPALVAWAVDAVVRAARDGRDVVDPPPC